MLTSRVKSPKVPVEEIISSISYKNTIIWSTEVNGSYYVEVKTPRSLFGLITGYDYSGKHFLARPDNAEMIVLSVYMIVKSTVGKDFKVKDFKFRGKELCFMK